MEVGSSYAAATPQGLTHGVAPVAQPPPGQSLQLSGWTEGLGLRVHEHNDNSDSVAGCVVPPAWGYHCTFDLQAERL